MGYFLCVCCGDGIRTHCGKVMSLVRPPGRSPAEVSLPNPVYLSKNIQEHPHIYIHTYIPSTIHNIYLSATGERTHDTLSPAHCGGDRIRTCEGLRPTRFPSVRLKPLSHSSAIGGIVPTESRIPPIGPRVLNKIGIDLIGTICL